MDRTRSKGAAYVAFLFLTATSICFAQDPPKDEALDRLLEKLEGNAKPAPAAEPAPKPKEKDKDQAPKPDAKKDAPKDNEKAKSQPAPPEDEALDSLLEKLGETKEKPATTGPAGGGAKPEDHDGLGGAKPDAKPEDASADRLKEGEKPLDEHLERLTGVIKKKKDQEGDQRQQGASEDSPIARAVKKMREVESKLGETDTGEETRKKQGEIIKDLERLIAQAKQQGQGRGRPGQRTRQGNQPGQQPGDQTGTDPNARGAGPMKTAKPVDTPALVGSKDVWGNLPAMLRDEMENVFRSEPLPSKTKQISRYYEAVSKKSLSRSRGE